MLWPSRKSPGRPRSKLSRRQTDWMIAFCERSDHLQHGACRSSPISTPRCQDRGQDLFRPASSSTSDYYGNVVGLNDCGYRAMPRVEQTLLSYLAPDAASSLKAPSLPSKPLRHHQRRWARCTCLKSG